MTAPGPAAVADSYAFDDLLSTTRAVRRRFDLTREVARSDIEACLDVALQAPTGSNRQNWHFLVVTDPGRRRQLGEIYRRARAIVRAAPRTATAIEPSDPSRAAAEAHAMSRSTDHLAATIDRVPGMLVPCFDGRPERGSGFEVASQMASVIPAAWSFMLAARARHIGTVWTTTHLELEQDAAGVLGVPYPEVTQVALIPFGHVLGAPFKRATREPLARVVHWDHW